MNEVVLKPERALKTVWMIVCLVSYSLAMIGALAPWVAEVAFGARIDGSLPTSIMAASFTLITLPFLVWLPSFYRSLEYRIDAESIRGKRGVFWKRTVTVPYHKVTNIDITQGPLQRAFGIGNLHVQTAGASGSQGGPAELVVFGFKDLEGLKESIMDRIASVKGSGVQRRGQSEAETLELILDELREIRRLKDNRI